MARSEYLAFHGNVLAQGRDHIFIFGALGRDSPSGELRLDLGKPYQGVSSPERR